MICAITGMTIQELLGWSPGITHRQMLMLTAWEEEQWNTPNRTDHYMMMLACITARANSTRPQSIQPKDFALKFERKDAKISKDDAEKQLAYAKASRAAALGGWKRITIVDREGNVIKPAELPPSTGRLANHPMLISRQEHANRTRNRNTGNQTDSGREGTQVTSTGGRTFTPKHRQKRLPKQQPNIISDRGDRPDSGGSDCINTGLKQYNADGV